MPDLQVEEDAFEALDPHHGVILWLPNFDADLDERLLDNWTGYRGELPVRVGNQAATHLQHDVFGEMEASAISGAVRIARCAARMRRTRSQRQGI